MTWFETALALAPTPEQLSGTVAIALLFVLMTALGSLVGGAKRAVEADPVVGFGLVALGFTATGVLVPGVPFTAVAVVLCLVAFGAMAWRRERSVDGLSGRVALLALPLVLLASAMIPTQWDEFSQWLFSPRFLLEADRFPRAGEDTGASFAAYPYGLPFLGYLAARLLGRFTENMPVLVNLGLLVAFAGLVARLAADGHAEARGQAAASAAKVGWGLAAAALLGSLVLPPFVVQKVTLTAYAEVATAVALAFGGVLGWRGVYALAAGDERRARALALQCGLALAALISVKQANLVLLASALVGIGLVGLRLSAIPLPVLARFLGLAAVAPLVLYGLWRHYVGIELAGAEFRVRGFAEWHLHLIPDVLATMAGIAAKKSGYFGLMLVLTVFAVRGLRTLRSPFEGLAIVAATVFVGYNAFLLFAYVTAFGPDDAVRAMSYWRYNMHVGALGGAAAAYGIGRLWAARGIALPRATSVAAVIVVLAAPLALAPKLRFDLHPVKRHAHAVAGELERQIPAGARFAVVDPLDAGFYARYMRYRLWGRAEMAFQYYAFNLDQPLADELAKRDVGYAWVHTQTAAVRQAFGLALPDGASYLVKRTEGGWEQVRDWPYVGYRLPTDVPD